MERETKPIFVENLGVESPSVLNYTDSLAPQLQNLFSHPVYSKVDDLESLRTFMEAHVFAVWDFMTLLKILQREMTCTNTPWIPPQNIEAARFVNEIVLSEETDEVEPGKYTSHFDLYISAMNEVGANTELIKAFIDQLRSGKTSGEILVSIDIPEYIKEYVLTTLDISKQPVHQVAAAFLFGREEIIPKMFQQILDQLERTSKVKCHYFRLYLQRHIDLDEDQHAPMGRKLLKSLCEGKSRRWQEAGEVASCTIGARYTVT